MSYPLAVLTPDLGAAVSTFIRRHATELLPGGTAVAGVRPAEGLEIDWKVEGPLLDLTWLAGGRLRWRLVQALVRGVGLPIESLAVRRFFERHGVRVALGEYLDFSLPWMAAAQRTAVRFFAHAHGYDVSRLLRDRRWREAYRCYSEAGGVITVNHPSREALVDLGLPPEKIHVVPCGVEVPEAVTLHARDSDEIRCLAVGRLVPQKAPILLLDSFRRAAECHSRLRLDYVGSGPLWPAVQQYVTALRLEGRVRLHGARPNTVVRAMLQETDIFLQHSMTDPETGDQEGLPVAILEAMAAGVPVASTRHAGIPEAVLEDVTGYLTEPGDSAAMAERIVILARDPDLRRRFGLAGHARARERFTWERERADLLRILGLEATAA